MKRLKSIANKATALILSIGLALTGIPVSTVCAVSHSRVSVHDPSIVKLEDGGYYIIGSHLAAARSDDLCSWSYTANSNYGTTNTTYFSDIYTDLAIPAAWSDTTDGYDLSGNLWAPDIVYNASMGKYCMYLSVNGDVWNSSIVLCTADQIDGPYTYAGTIVYSGFTNNTVNNVNDTDVPKVLGENPDISCYLSGGSWDASYGTNAIDPCVFYDENGTLWMSYGSWFGGIYMLQLDQSTGLRDYTVSYDTITNESDAYMGKKIAGGYYNSGEGSYIEYMENENGVGYYYLFLSYGYYNANGGYNMRVFRSENPDGPYVDENGNQAIYTTYATASNNIGGTTGQRLMSNYQWDADSTVYKAQGHNSALMDDDGNLYLIYHTKFDDAYGLHEIRVHQMFINADGWLTVAPYEYSGERLSTTGHTMAAVTGTYQFLFHTLNQTFVNETSSDVETPSTVTLLADGTITGDVTGTWTMESGTPNMTITVDGVTYQGEFLVQADESAAQVQRMTFTVTGNNTCIWGSKTEAYEATLDHTDLTNDSSELTYQPGAVSYENGSVTIGDTTLLSDVSYTITSKFSGKQLDLTNGQAVSGTNVQQWSENGASAQEWRIVDLGDGYCKIVSMVDETFALAVDGTDATNGSNVCVQSYTGSDSQKWKLIESDGYYGIVSKCSGDTAGLDLYDWSEADGGNIDQWEFWGGDCQLWSITPVYPAVTEASYFLRNVNSGLYLGTDGSNVQQAAEETAWAVQKNEDGSYSFLQKNGTAISFESTNDSTDGTNVELSTYTEATEQKFTILPCADGSYTILSDWFSDALSLDVYEMSLDDGANICLWSYWGGAGQKWVLIPAETVEIEMPITTTTTITPSDLIGDIDQNGVADQADLNLIQQYLLAKMEFSKEQFDTADVNVDGKVDGLDLTLLRQMIAANT